MLYTNAILNYLGSQCPGDIDPQGIAPIWPGICCSTCKCPKLEALRIHLAQIGKPLDHTDWICMQPRFTIVEMLNHVVGRIADEWLRVDHQPRLPLGSQNICCVKIG